MSLQQLQDSGPLAPDRLYVVRAADEQVFSALRQGELCHVLGPPQSGKSSLALRTARRLGELGTRCAVVDLRATERAGVDPGTWFLQITRQIAEKTGIETRPDWYGETAEPAGLLVRFLSEDLLQRVREVPVVLFFDGTGALFSLSFPPGDFLAALRAACTGRNEDPELGRLTFCLLGPHPPASLTREPEKTLPPGRTVLLEDFTGEEMRQWLPALRDTLPNPETVLDRVHEWTSGHPSMTQKVLMALLQRSRIPAAKIGIEVNEAIHRLFLRGGRGEEPSLAEAERRCLAVEAGASPLEKLSLYEQILELGGLNLDRHDPVQMALRLGGLAAERRDGGEEPRLDVRNSIVSQLFDQEWIAEARSRSSPVEKPAAAPPSFTLAKVNHLVKGLFCDPQAPYGPYRLVGEGEELLENTLYRYVLQGEHERVALQIYREIGGIGGALWEQEVRALIRLSSRSHASLPRILKGHYLEEEQIAFVTAAASRYTLGHAGAMEALRGRPREAVRQLALLAEGLTLLHGNGLMHRNLGPEAIEVLEDDDGGLRLRFSRFEMSSLVSNLLRRVARNQHEEMKDQDRRVRTFLRRQGIQALACAPPERLALIFEKKGSVEGPPTDVFGLGVIAYQWFVGPLPEEYLARVFVGDPWSPVDWDSDQHGALFKEMHRRLHRTVPLPGPLRQLLEGMTRFEWRLRLTASEVVNQISAHYEEISSFFAPPGEQQEYLVTYIPRETGATLRGWGLLKHDPQTDPGREELREILGRDLRHAVLTFSPQGFSPYEDDPKTRHGETHYVLLGDKAAYFASLYQHRGAPWQKPGVGGPKTMPEVLMIRFVMERRRVWRIEANRLKRRVPPLRFVPMDAEELDPANPTNRPSWEPLVRSVETEKAPPWHGEMDRALEWLLELQAVQLDVRMYAVTVETQDGLGAELSRDPERDQNWIWKDHLRNLYASNADRRPRLGHLFEQLSAEESPEILFRPESQGAPNWDDKVAYRLQLADVLNPDRIRIRWSPPHPALPAKGWIQPAGDLGSRSQLKRQYQAYRRLMEMPGLIDQLHDPASVVRLRNRWPKAGQGLDGNAPEVILEMLDRWPFFALHGPPGTGKTTVAAHAVEQTLRQDGSLRILVSAQSHYALDNLAERILDQLGPELGASVSALRIVAPHSETKVSERMKAYLPALLTQSRIRAIEKACAKRLNEGGDSAKVKEIIARWQAEVSRSELELQKRLRRGANLLFATTGTATDRYLGAESGFDVCDWVIVEEAAKAWPTELAMPLVQGLRWTLIGDHLQLPAFGKQEVEAFLQECGLSSERELLEHFRNRKAYLRAFRLFGSLFDRPKEGEEAEEAEKTSRSLGRPVQELTMQFRMRSPIANVVSDAFYKDFLRSGRLETHPKADLREHEFQTPGWLTGESLVWVDTTGLVEAREEPRWKNPAEAEIVRKIVASLRAGRSKAPLPHRLAVLSPYLAQVRLLKDTLRRASDPALLDCVHTVDSFQGREADVVIVSLVRSNDGWTPMGRLGFLVYPERINVLFSRARCLLVIVGSFAHFQTTQGTFWPALCENVLRHGKRLPASTAGLASGPLETR